MPSWLQKSKRKQLEHDESNSDIGPNAIEAFSFGNKSAPTREEIMGQNCQFHSIALCICYGSGLDPLRHLPGAAISASSALFILLRPTSLPQFSTPKSSILALKILGYTIQHVG